MGIQPAKGVDHTFRRLAGFRQHHPDTLRAFHQLDHQRRAADQLDQVASVVRRMGKAGDRQIDALPRQQLQRTQLIASAGNGHGFVERVAAKQLELAQHRGAVKGDGGADARDHRVITLQLAAAIVNGRRRRVDVHITGKRIDDIDAVPAIFRRFTQPLARIERSVARKNGNFHSSPQKPTPARQAG